MRRLTHIIVLVAFTFSCGGHWLLFQGIAWANMIREYSEVVPLAQAVQMTFSGQYPCSMCKAIAEKKSSEDQKMLGLDKYDKKFLSVESAQDFKRPGFPVVYSDLSKKLYFRSDSPSVPPPRFPLA